MLGMKTKCLQTHWKAERRFSKRFNLSEKVKIRTRLITVNLCFSEIKRYDFLGKLLNSIFYFDDMLGMKIKCLQTHWKAERRFSKRFNLSEKVKIRTRLITVNLCFSEIKRYDFLGKLLNSMFCFDDMLGMKIKCLQTHWKAERCFSKRFNLSEKYKSVLV